MFICNIMALFIIPFKLTFLCCTCNITNYNIILLVVIRFNGSLYSETMVMTIFKLVTY